MKVFVCQEQMPVGAMKINQTIKKSKKGNEFDSFPYAIILTLTRIINMQNIKIITILISMTLIFGGCSNNSRNIVKLESTEVTKLNLGNPIRIVILERTAESQLESIKKTAIDLPNNRIFVLSDFNLFIFDTDGKFLTKLKKGKGPGEISKIIYFSVDRDQKLIYATQDRANVICTIDYNGNIKRTHTLFDYHCQAIEPLDNLNVLLVNNTVSNTDPYFIGNCNLEKDTITKRYISANNSEYPLLAYAMVSNFTKSNGRLYFANANIFGLFEYKDNNFKKILSYDLGNRKVPKSFSEQFEPKRRMGVFQDEAKRRGFVPKLISSFFFKGYNLVILEDENNSCYAIKSNDYQTVYLNGSIADYFNLPNVESLKNIVEVNQDYLTFSCEPLDFYDINEVNKTKNLNIGNFNIDFNYDSNPFLIVVE
jgi:hypothetical protein